MSIEQPLDQQLIEQTKRQIQALVQEIAQLSRQNVSPGEFYSEFLGRVVSALAAVGGAVWAINDEGQLALQYQINFQLTNLRNDEDGPGPPRPPAVQGAGLDGRDVGRRRTRGRATTTRRPTPPISSWCWPPCGPTWKWWAWSRSSSGATPGRPSSGDICGSCCKCASWPADFLKSHQLRHFSDRQVLWSRLEDFTRTVHASLEPLETAYTIANEGRRLIECDRVSVAIRKGNRCVIEAVSGQDVFDKRSNTIRLLARLASAVVATGEPIWYTGDTRDMAPQVEEAVQEYVDESHSKTVAVLPLAASAAGRGGRSREAAGAAEPPIGALIVEQIEDSRLAPAHGAAGGGGLPAQFHGAGQRPGAPEPVPHARVAGAGQEPLDRRRPDPAQDAHHRRRGAGRWWWRCVSGRPTSSCSPRGRWSRSIASDVFAGIDGVVVDVPRASTATGGRAGNCWSGSATPTPKRP